MGIILLVSRPYANAVALVQVIAGPMILSNAVGAALFMSIIRDQKNTVDRIAAVSSAKAFKIAERTLNILARGINGETAGGSGQDHSQGDGRGFGRHHRQGDGDWPLSARARITTNPAALSCRRFTKAAIRENKVIFAGRRRASTISVRCRTPVRCTPCWLFPSISTTT